MGIAGTDKSRDKRRKPHRISRSHSGSFSPDECPSIPTKKCHRLVDLLTKRNPRQRAVQAVPITGVVMVIRTLIAIDTVMGRARALPTDRTDTNQTVAIAVRIGERSESRIESGVSDEKKRLL